jgi:spore coat polysaccharide biosynthesis protein SpsF
MFTDEQTVAATSSRTSPLGAAAIVVCRLDSSRLPGKVLRPVMGRPLLSWILTRLERTTCFDRGLIVATSTRPVDDPIAAYCDARGIRCFRGAGDDVAGRVLACAETYRLNWFARVNADSPFVDSELLEQACRVAAEMSIDLVTNLSPRTFPYGVSVELVRVSAFRRAYKRMSTPAHFEHVTRILYEIPRLCSRYNLCRAGDDLSNQRLTLDTAEDWERFLRIVHRARNRAEQISYEEAIRIAGSMEEAA